MSGNLVTVISKLMSKKYAEMVGPAISIAKSGANLAGIKTNGSEDIEGDIKGKVEGTITIGMDGTIDTEGTIRGSAPTVGVPSPTIFLKDFDTKHSHIGQGVWNLKRPPVVYVSYLTYRESSSLMTPCFFDPNSIEVELNPDVFPESEIEWISVESTCSSKTSIQENDDMRRAYGLNSYKTNFDQTIVDAHPTGYNTDFDMVYKIDGRNQYENTALHDFLYASKDKMGFENSCSPYPMLGRKYNDFWLEPVYISNENRVASHEVNVIVQVKLKSIDAPIVYVRNYLPEYKVYDYGEFQNSVKRFTEKYRHSDMYDYQMQRIADICSIYSLKYNKPYTVTKATEGNYANAGASNLFNSDFNDPWYVKTSDKQNGIWYVEFYRNDRAITPVSYVLSVRGNNTSTKNRNPKSWKLKAKLNEGDQWVTISEKNNASILVDCVNYASKTFDLSVTGRQWKYFRLEVSENWGDDVMQIGEFNFNE